MLWIPFLQLYKIPWSHKILMWDLISSKWYHRNSSTFFRLFFPFYTMRVSNTFAVGNIFCLRIRLSRRLGFCYTLLLHYIFDIKNKRCFWSYYWAYCCSWFTHIVEGLATIWDTKIDLDDNLWICKNGNYC